MDGIKNPRLRGSEDGVFGRDEWLPHKDSNLNKQIQNLLCYHYTMRQYGTKTARIIDF